MLQEMFWVLDLLLPVNITSSATYYATISGNCIAGTSVDSITMTVPPCFSIDLNSTQASCLGNDGTIICTPDTLLPLWEAELFDMSGNSVFLASNITDSIYIFNDLISRNLYCSSNIWNYTAVDTIIVTQVQNPISIALNPTHVNCYAGNDGQISVDAVGGLLPYHIISMEF